MGSGQGRVKGGGRVGPRVEEGDLLPTNRELQRDDEPRGADVELSHVDAADGALVEKMGIDLRMHTTMSVCMHTIVHGHGHGGGLTFFSLRSLSISMMCNGIPCDRSVTREARSLGIDSMCTRKWLAIISRVSPWSSPWRLITRWLRTEAL